MYTELTHLYYILKDSNFDFRYVRLCDLDIPREKMVELFANSGNPDQTPPSAASDLGLHCLPTTLLGVSRLQWVKWKHERTIIHRTQIEQMRRNCLKIPP